MPYTLEVSHEFCAAHALTISGAHEPVHGHNFRVLATVAGDELDDDGLLCDFHTVHGVLVEICEPLNNVDLNAVDPFTSLNPTAEHIARYIADELAERLDASLADAAHVESVSVTEAAGCRAVYSRPRP
ncbi:MAG: 6-carboxytetrahydropterin synthase QueD [Phycisphaerae bacterium]|nr:6-carboxytetrahydropterin synthase QueD [Phycisphaerae bacterium]